MLSRSKKSAVVLMVGALLLTAGCAGKAGTQGGAPTSDGASSEGVPAGASKEDFIAAFADMEPITLTTQAVEAKGNPEAQYYLDFVESLSEWSGGKLTMEIAYGNSIASPSDIPQALADGRVNMERAYPLYDPSRYPANAAFAESAFLGNQSPVAGSLQTFAAYLEVGLGMSDVLQPEFAEQGMVALLPYAPQTAPGILCAEPHETGGGWEGTQIRVSGSAHADQVRALGMSPISLSYAEVYPAIERGTIDCLVGADWSFRTTGVLPLAPNYVLDSEAGFTKTATAVAFTKSTWDELPLVARQLIWDRLDIWIGHFFGDHIFNAMAAAQEDILAAGAEVTQFDDASRKSLLAANKTLLEKVEGSEVIDGEKLVSDLEAALAKWEKIVVDELGYTEAVGEDFITAIRSDDFDIAPFMERLKQEILLPNRPE